MNRALLLCLLLSANAYGAGMPTSFYPHLVKNFHALNDSLPPTIECPPNDTVSAAQGECEAMYNYTVTFGDDQPNPILIQLSGLASGSFFPVGTITNVFLVTDQVANTATCSFTVTVEHFTTSLNCHNEVEIVLDQNCTAEVNALQMLEPPFGCPGVYTVQIDKTTPLGNGPWLPANLGQGDLGKTYMVQVTDPVTGNNCFGVIEISDTLPPALVCQDITIPCAVINTTPGYLKDSLGVTDALPQAPDACGGQVALDFIDTYISEDCLSPFTETIKRQWTATDERGNQTTCIQNVHLARTQLDDIKLPPDVTLNCKNPNLSLENTGKPFIEFGGKSFDDLLCSVDVNFTDSVVFACPGSQVFYRSWTFTDICSNATKDTIQRIDIPDVTGPDVDCDSSLFVMVPGANCTGEVQLPPVSISDDCSPVASIAAYWTADDSTFTLNGTLSNGGTTGSFDVVSDFPVFSSTVTYVATDSCGNTGICEILVTVADSAAPAAMCFPFLTASLSADGSFALGADTIDFNSNVACGQQLYFKVRRANSNPECLTGDQFDDFVAFCCADVGDTLDVILRVYDVPVPDGQVTMDLALSQSSDCVMKIYVQDTFPATCTPPADVSVLCTDFDPDLASYGDMVPSCSVDSSVVHVDYSLFDTTCLYQTILRTFQVYDENGEGSACTQQIVVTYLQDYYIRFPDDVIATSCSPSGIYGEPEFLNNGCGQMAATFTDEVFTDVPDACLRIERTWLVYNTCTYDSLLPVIAIPNPTPNATVNSPQNLPGPVVSPPGTPFPWSPTVVAIAPGQQPTDFSTFWDSSANAYSYKQIIKIIDTEDPVADCPSGLASFGDTTVNDPMLWNQSYWWDQVVSQHDLCEGDSPLTITATDSCAGSNMTISYLLFLDLDSIPGMETVVSSGDLPAPGEVNYNNAGNPNYTGGTPQIFDGRPVPTDDVYRFAMHRTFSGNTSTASVQWKTSAQMMPDSANPYGLPGIAPQLPYGTHRIRWIIADGCGNETACDYEFVVKDVKAPEINCLTGLTINMLPVKSVKVNTNDLLLSVLDNCTPPTPFNGDTVLLKISVRKSGAGTGFPLDSIGEPVDGVAFDCTELGAQTGELWALDLAGNTAMCTFELTIVDSSDYCNPDLPDVAGIIRTESDTPVVNATLMLAATHPAAPDINLQTLTDSVGQFLFEDAFPFESDYTLTPFKNNNHLNGVSTFDLVLISRHILDLQPLGSPYKLIAADANKNGAVTTFDVVEFRKLILGIYDELPANTSWRFVDKDFVFPNPANPFETPFPESIARTNVTTDNLEDDFVGIKVGDVNNTASPDSLLVPDDRNAGVLYFQLDDRAVRPGEEFTVRFKGSEKVAGYQFTLNINGLEFITVLPGAGMSDENFGIFPDALTASVESGGDEFALAFRAQQAGRLSEMLAISSRITRAEAYRVNDVNDDNDAIIPLDVALSFGNGIVPKAGFELYQNRPNPWNGKTSVGFNLPEAAGVVFTVFDETGRVLYSKSEHCAEGYRTIVIDRALPEGVLFYKLETATHSAVRKMVVLR